MNMGSGPMIGILKSIREKIGKQPGDVVKVTVKTDTSTRIVEVPVDFQKELDKNTKAKEIFEKMSYSHKKEYVQHIEKAKKQETRQLRIEQAIEKIIKT